MAISVLKQPEGFTKPTYIAECPTCGSVMTYTYEDTEEPAVSSFHERSIKCPVCGEDVLHSRIVDSEEARKKFDIK